MHAFWQTLVDGVITGSSYAIIGIAIALILGTTGRFHFGFATTFTLGAYVTSVLISSAGVPWALAVLAGIGAAVVLGVLIEAAIYRPIERRSRADASMPVFVAALGVTIIGENIIRLVWTSNSRTLEAFTPLPIRLGGIATNTLGVVTVVTAVVLTLALSMVLRRTSLGRQIKAVRVNLEMAMAVGIRVRSIFLLVFAIGSGIGAVAAILQGMKFAVAPNMGTDPLLYGFVVAFLAGTRSDPVRVGLSGLLLGLAQSISTLWVSQQLSIVAVFGVLIVFLSYRSLRIALSRHTQSPLKVVLAAIRSNGHSANRQPGV